MGLDALLKRYFVFLMIIPVAMAAYYHASGVSSFLGGRLLVDSADLAEAAPTVRPSLSSLLAQGAAVRPKVSGEPILERNPFDSVTGPLTGVDGGPGDGGLPREQEVDFSEPYSAPECADARVFIITAADDPDWSVAVVSEGPKGEKRLRRTGDSVGPRQVWHIGWDRVWLHGPGDLCQAKMFSHSKGPAPVAKPAPKPKPGVRTSKRGGPPKVPKDIADKIQKVSDTEFNVDRVVVDQILENQGELMRSARIVPEKKDGKVLGIRLLRVRPDTLLGTLGLQDGDRLEKINGFDITSPEKALEAYARLRTAGNLSVSITRKGKPVTIDFNIR